MDDQLLLKALRREQVERPPIWLMRQAGRYMAEYRAVREGKSFLELCKTPSLCADVMRTAVERIGVDAAIIFSDLLPILEPLGFELSFLPGEGPHIANPLSKPEDLSRVNARFDLSLLDFTFETVELTRRAVAPLPVIGFAGAPFTLASYAIEGGASRQFTRTLTFMKTFPTAWRDFLSLLARSAARYLNAQIESGAHVVQIFDSWVGRLSAEDYREYVLPATRELVAALTPGAPIIYFGSGAPSLVSSFATLNVDCISVDWRTPIADAWKVVGERAIQGNLDPATLLAPQDVIEREAVRILSTVGNRPGFIFNLGHGILKETPVENVEFLVKIVKGWSL